MILIPITYHSKKYPVGITSNIDEIAGNFDKSSISPIRKYSLHTEYSHMKRKLDNSLINKYPKLKSSQKDNIPQLWKDKEWAQEFANYIIDLIGNNQPPEIIEVHPPFNDYCLDFDNFFDTYIEFERIILQKYPNVKIFIENVNKYKCDKKEKIKFQICLGGLVKIPVLSKKTGTRPYSSMPSSR